MSALAALLLAAAAQAGAGTRSPEVLASWVHDGFPPAAAPEREQLTGTARLAWDLAQLVPARVSGRAVDPEVRAEALARAIQSPG